MTNMPDVKDIISLIQATPSKEDVVLVTKAYEFAQTAHSNHKRYSGEPYFIHLVETAKTLAEFGMGSKTIAAGLLHDSIEDTEVTEEIIKKEFGDEILFLVQGTTKLRQLKYRGVERHTESLRKLFVATSQDVRVLIIKLADRLHNMRTLQHVPKEKQQRIASETLEIYVPLAYRLGVRKLHRELEDLAFMYTYPDEYKKIQEVLKQKSAEILKRLEKLQKSVKKAFAKEKFTTIQTERRMKGLFSLYKKLQRKDMDMDKVYDVAALRIIVPTVSDCYRALGIVHSVWRPLPGRIKDYIAFPKPNGYQSLHTTIFTGDGSIFEIQIRTELMHREAEYGVASHLLYKEGSVKRLFNQNLEWLLQLLPNSKTKISEPAPIKKKVKKPKIPRWVAQLAQEQQSMSLEPQEFIKSLKADFFEHRIFVFTPKGDVVDLPTESSPIDFAYAIHSDIGDHIAGVKVNGKLVSLETKLRNGDIVHIDIKEANHPTQKWFDLAKTTMAKRYIRQALLKAKS